MLHSGLTPSCSEWAIRQQVAALDCAVVRSRSPLPSFTTGAAVAGSERRGDGGFWAAGTGGELGAHGRCLLAC